MARRRTGPDPKEAALAEARCLNPHPDQVTDPEFLASDFFDARDAVQVKYEMVRKVKAGGAPVTQATAAFGYSRPATTPQPRHWRPPGWKGWCRPGPARAAGTNSPTRSSPGPSSSWPPARPAPGPAGRPDRAGLRRARAPPLGRASAGPPPGAPLQKPLTCPPARCGRRSTRPCPCSHHLATRLRPGRPPGCRPGQCPRRRAGCPLRATAPCRPARTREAFPLGSAC